MKSIKNWAEVDRPREKMVRKGAPVLTDAELLAILIGSGTRSQSAVELAREILTFVQNDLSTLSKLSIPQLMNFKGIGQAKAVSIAAALELSRRREGRSHVKRKRINSSNDCYSYIRPVFMDLMHEEFHVVYLNRANEIIDAFQLSKGGLSGTVADGKLIFHRALELKSSALILAHNHPSGQLKPSQADIRLTKSLVDFGKMIDLQVLDHLILTDNNYFSFADEGLIG